jgi:hypothetical protein
MMPLQGIHKGDKEFLEFNFRTPDMVSLIPVRFFRGGSSILLNFTGMESRARK